ncbi:uncharacterized protein L969DRAFT_82839 [Mixia osmundae IAM 14324]|uniref:uncharacterized protein n=1 Tax=Mixia osmundae (strain CBS 9802 / IAM 14324 / JCM 22182 / KY 12970) TaxID=764103 RepID=UPI0004A54BF3|nr:uncharacterized protein L969DRAFT_82839 [Mixia osmundae IAM 14324]KEI37971.1 hypothetical protein L969DRAFT_82839 [Mixia osmundae IAM 14324]
MSLLSRLGLARTASHDDTTRPIVRFIEHWKAIQSLLAVAERKKDRITEGQIEEHIHAAFVLLVEDEAAEREDPGPSDCLECALNNNLLAVLLQRPSQLAQGYLLMLDKLEPDVLVHRKIHRPLLELLRWQDASLRSPDEQLRTLVLDLACRIAHTLAQHAGLLPIFLNNALPIKEQQRPSNGKAHTKATVDFPAFQILLQQMHSDARAREALLELVDLGIRPSLDACSAPTVALAEYLLASYLPDSVAASLTAVYAALPRKLRRHTVKLGSDRPRLTSESDEDISRSLEALRVAVRFAQDVFGRASPARTSEADEHWQATTRLRARLQAAVLASIETHFQSAVLLPTLQSCSSEDGSALAVMTYLTIIFEELEPVSALSASFRRLFGLEQQSNFLACLVLDHLQTPDLSATSLSLLAALVQHHPSCMLSFFASENCDPPAQDDNDSYGDRLAARDDALQALLALGSRLELQASTNGQSELLRSTDIGAYLVQAQSAIRPHIIESMQPNCSVTVTEAAATPLLTMLARFHANDVAVNLALTRAILAIAYLPTMSLQGWLWPSSGTTDGIIISMLHALAAHLPSFEKQCEGLATHLAARRAALLSADMITDALGSRHFSTLSTAKRHKSRPSLTRAWFSNETNDSGSVDPVILHYPTTPSSSLVNGTIAKESKIQLSVLLDNLVILSEFVKEIVAVLQVRTELGLDPV